MEWRWQASTSTTSSRTTWRWSAASRARRSTALRSSSCDLWAASIKHTSNLELQAVSSSMSSSSWRTRMDRIPARRRTAYLSKARVSCVSQSLERWHRRQVSKTPVQWFPSCDMWLSRSHPTIQPMWTLESIQCLISENFEKKRPLRMLQHTSATWRACSLRWIL